MTSNYEQPLDSFDRSERESALRAAVAAGGGYGPDTDNHNMHFHSFFSPPLSTFNKHYLI